MNVSTPEFIPYPKTPRLFSEATITEKLDGTNALVHVLPDGTVLAGSRNRYLTEEKDNYGFCAWVNKHRDQLRQLGPGKHYGEWWGQGIQRGYDQHERHFSLFNTRRWADLTHVPDCCRVVPTLYQGPFSWHDIQRTVNALFAYGSYAANGYPHPEGIVVFHKASGKVYKVTEKDAHMVNYRNPTI